MRFECTCCGAHDADAGECANCRAGWKRPITEIPPPPRPATARPALALVGSHR